MAKDPSNKMTTENRERKKSNYQLQFLVSAMLVVILFVANMIVLVCAPNMLVVNIIITLAMLASVFLISDAFFKGIDENRQENEENLESIAIAQKANYLLIKKAYDEISALKFMSSGGASTEEIINAQKAVAKVTLGREKENTDMIIATVSGLQNQLVVIQQEVNAIKNNGMEETLFTELSQMDASMKDSMNDLSMTLSGFQNEIEHMADTLASIIVREKESMKEESERIAEEKAALLNFMEAEKPVEAEMPTMEEIIPTDEEELKLEDTLSIDDIVGSIEENPLPMDDISLADDIALDSDTTLGDDFSLDSDITLGDEISLDSDINLGDEVSLDSDITLGDEISLDSDINLMDDISLEEDTLDNEMRLDDISDTEATLDALLKMVDDPSLDMLAESAIEPESATMSPEDIQALLASAAEEVAQEDMVMPKEDKAGMPDLSDPHKVMTPDEIAALLENM